MNKATQKDKSFAVIFWTIMISISLTAPLIYFLFKLGFFDYDDNQSLVSIPVKIEKLAIKGSFGCGFHIRGTKDYFCIKSKYQYDYQGKTYFKEEVSSGLLLVSQAKAEEIKKNLLDKKRGYISPQKPEYSLLIKREDYLGYEVHDISSGWFSSFIVIPIIIFGFVTLLGFNSLFSNSKSRLPKNKITKRYAPLYKRFLALWIDTSIFIATIVFLIAFYGIFSLSYDSGEKSIIRSYSEITLPLFIFSSWVFFSKTIGMHLTNLTILDSNTLRKPTIQQFVIRFVGSTLILLSGGILFFLASLDRKKQTIIDKISNTIVIEGVIDIPQNS